MTKEEIKQIINSLAATEDQKQSLYQRLDSLSEEKMGSFYQDLLIVQKSQSVVEAEAKMLHMDKLFEQLRAETRKIGQEIIEEELAKVEKVKEDGILQKIKEM